MADTATENLTVVTSASRNDCLLIKQAVDPQLRQAVAGEAYFSALQWMCAEILITNNAGSNAVSLRNDSVVKPSPGFGAPSFFGLYIRLPISPMAGMIGALVIKPSKELAGLYQFGPTVVVDAADIAVWRVSDNTQRTASTETGLQGGSIQVLAAIWPRQL